MLELDVCLVTYFNTLPTIASLSWRCNTDGFAERSVSATHRFFSFFFFLSRVADALISGEQFVITCQVEAAP